MSADRDALQAALDANLESQAEMLSTLRRLRADEADLRALLDTMPASSATSLPDTDWAGASFEWDQRLQEALLKRFGHSSFRPLQREVMNATLSDRDVFAVLQTGSGKSLLFQLPGLLRPSGLTVVISPLVSLMVDQVASLERLGIRSSLLAAELTDRQASTQIHHDIADPSVSGLRFLYVTPERIAKSKMLLSRLQKAYEAGHLLRFAIDEAHCAAAQGHDFRPDYLSLGTLRSSFPNVPILCLTATASEAVRADVERTLQMDAATTVRFRGHFDRANITFSVRRKPNEDALLDEMAEIALRVHRAAAGIVYTLSRADAEKVASGLAQRGVRCAAYHAGVDGSQRALIQSAWQQGRLQLVVATIAFGLGIDKPDVRFVLHHTFSKSLESYYQESGRAGRDGLPSEAISWFQPADFYRLASLAAESSDRGAAMSALMAAGRFCEDGNTCRRQQLAQLFGQELPRREGAEARARCCDVCAAGLAAEDGSAERQPADAPSSELRDVEPLATEALRVLAELNRQAADSGVASDGGAAPAKLTALKLAEKCGKLRHAGSSHKPTRRCIEHVLLRLVLANAIHLHFSFTAYSILTYLYVGEHANRSLGRSDAAGALRLPTLARTLPADLLPAPTEPKCTGNGAARKRKLVPPDAASDDDDFEPSKPSGGRDATGSGLGGARYPKATGVMGAAAGRGNPLSATRGARTAEVVNLDSDESE